MVSHCWYSQRTCINAVAKLGPRVWGRTLTPYLLRNLYHTPMRNVEFTVRTKSVYREKKNHFSSTCAFLDTIDVLSSLSLSLSLSVSLSLSRSLPFCLLRHLPFSKLRTKLMLRIFFCVNRHINAVYFRGFFLERKWFASLQSDLGLVWFICSSIQSHV